MALAHAEHGCGDAWVGVAAHPGEGVFMLQSIDPSVADEHDPFSVVAELDMYDPDERLAAVARAVARTTRSGSRGTAPRSGRASRASTRGARDQLDDVGARRAPGCATSSAGADEWRRLRKRAVHLEYLTIYRTLADPAYLDLSIDPDDRPLGSLFAFPDPFDANYGRGGLARTMTSRGWLSTWSALSSPARLATTMPEVHVPVAASCTRPPTPRSASARRARSPTRPAPTTSRTSR